VDIHQHHIGRKRRNGLEGVFGGIAGANTAVARGFINKAGEAVSEITIIFNHGDTNRHKSGRGQRQGDQIGCADIDPAAAFKVTTDLFQTPLHVGKAVLAGSAV
jgi:hypothetical protein